MTSTSQKGGSPMILIVREHLEPLANVADALAALIGSGVVGTFEIPEDPDNKDAFRIPPTKAIQIICDNDKAGCAKAGFYAAGFEVTTATGAAHDPGDIDPVTITLTPAKDDSLQDYPIGIGPGAIMAAKALCGAFVTRPIGPNGDSYIGDNPERSIQVRCNRANILLVQRGFFAAHFKAEAGLWPFN
jgi:hypothetical protein